VKIVLGLALLFTSAAWADEAADRAAVEATVSALNTSPTPSGIFTADFPNASELQRLKGEAQPGIVRFPPEGVTIPTQTGTLVVSREPMGEATWYPGPAVSATAIAIAPRFVTRSVTFVAPDTAVVLATYQQQAVLFVVKNEGTNWRIASFRVLSEVRTKAL
jgi:hypothetical protein